MKRRYRAAFSRKTFLKDARRLFTKTSRRVLHDALLLFYAFDRRDTPFWAKSIIIGVLGYFISPIDTIPDLTPVLGYTDDFNFILLALVTLGAYINEEVKFRAESKIHDWFGPNPDDSSYMGAMEAE